MTSFLGELAALVWEKHKQETRSVCLVLPNRRAGLFFRKHLARLAGKPVWAPRVMTIEEVITSISGLSITDPTDLLFGLYDVHREIGKDEAQDFESLMQWGPMLIKDFSDLDLCMADATAVFRHLDAERAMALWNPDGKPLTDMQQQYLRFYRSLEAHYQLFKERLLKNNTAYMGLAFRRAAESAEKISRMARENHYIFAGFNALSPSEEVVIKSFIDSGKAEIYWDADPYYLDHHAHEAGTSLRKIRTGWKLKELRFTSPHLKSHPSELHICGVAGHSGQAEYCAGILATVPKEEIESTCIVLADERLLIPLMNAIPADKGTFNVTMGYPLHQTPLHQLIRNLIRMHEQGGRIRGMRKRDESVFYLNDVIEILNHHYIAVISGNASHALAAGSLSKNQIFFPTPDDLKKMITEFGGPWEKIGFMFGPWTEGADFFFKGIEALLGHLKNAFSKREGNLADLEFVFQYQCLLNKLKENIRGKENAFSFRSSSALLNQLSQSLSIPFYGEPLEGLQIMGLLETRGLDFKRVIILSCNDDRLPGKASHNSFIPFELRLAFGLPTFREQESVTAYHFYRLLQRSEDVHMVYNAIPDELGGGDRSRFIEQLMTELPAHNPGVRIHSSFFSLPPRLKSVVPRIKISKSTEIMDMLKARAAKGFSPSSLNAYLSCSLKFYFTEILGIRDEEKPEEQTDSATMGKAIHEVMFGLYQPFGGKNISSGDFEKMKDRVPLMVASALAKNHPGGDFRYGKNLLVLKVAAMYINQLLDREAEFTKDHDLKILELETQLEKYYEVSGYPVLLKGIADRIDKSGGLIRIIDYKTGLVKASELKAESPEDFLDEEKSRDKCFQLLYYAFLYLRNHPEEAGKISSGIISFRALNQGLMSASLGKSELFTAEHGDEMERLVLGIAEEILNPSLPFIQTMEEKHCQYCIHKQVCLRV